MQAWVPLRGSVCNDDFLTDLAGIIGDHGTWLWDRGNGQIEQVLCGATLDVLDLLYPAGSHGLRVALTEPAFGLPPLRIAFFLDDVNVVYVAASFREWPA